jgi:hypothetical protein
VFVVPQGIQAGQKQSDGHAYWKIRISSVHQGVGKFWVVGVWFYSPSDLEKLRPSQRCFFVYMSSLGKIYNILMTLCRDRELIALMGNAELLESDHVQIIDAACIEGM